MEVNTCIPARAMRRHGNAGTSARKMQPDTLAQKQGEEEIQTMVSRECPGITQGILKPSVALKLLVLGRGCGEMKLAAPVY